MRTTLMITLALTIVGCQSGEATTESPGGQTQQVSEGGDNDTGSTGGGGDGGSDENPTYTCGIPDECADCFRPERAFVEAGFANNRLNPDGVWSYTDVDSGEVFPYITFLIEGEDGTRCRSTIEVGTDSFRSDVYAPWLSDIPGATWGVDIPLTASGSFEYSTCENLAPAVWGSETSILTALSLHGDYLGFYLGPLDEQVEYLLRAEGQYDEQYTIGAGMRWQGRIHHGYAEVLRLDDAMMFYDSPGFYHTSDSFSAITDPEDQSFAAHLNFEGEDISLDGMWIDMCALLE